MKDFSIKKLYYSISEVSKITEIEQYVLRYWESEFEQLKPQKNRAGNRAYTNKDIQLILLIKSLLREKKYTIDGAKKILEEKTSNKVLAPESESDNSVNEIETKQENTQSLSTEKRIDNNNPELKKDLLEIKKLLEDILKIL